MSKKLILLMFLSFFIFSCSEKREGEIYFAETSPVSVQLERGTPFNLNILVDPYSSSLQIVDTCLITFETGSENVFEVYNTNSHNRIAVFGKKGRGPGEFGRFTALTGQIAVDAVSNKSIVHVYDIDEKKLHYVDLYAAINDNSYINKTEIFSDLNLKPAKVAYKNDSLLYFLPMAGGNNARLVKYNLKTKRMYSTPYLPDIGIPIRDENKWMAYYSVFVVSEKSQKIAAAPLFFGQIDFFDFNGQYMNSTNFDDFSKYREDLMAENLTKTNIKQNIVEMKGNNDAIYALNLDLSYEIIRTNAIPGNSKVLKFDWNGKLLKEYVLDQPVTSIAIDEIHNRLYVINPYNEEHSIWYYDLD